MSVHRLASCASEHAATAPASYSSCPYMHGCRVTAARCNCKQGKLPMPPTGAHERVLHAPAAAGGGRQQDAARRLLLHLLRLHQDAVAQGRHLQWREQGRGGEQQKEVE